MLPTITDDCLPIYLSADCSIYCVVSRHRYPFFSQWKWRWIASKGKKRKLYARRSFRVGGRGGRNTNFYIHKEVCLLVNGLPPTPEHTVGDHKDGDSLNCRDNNLHWATPIENRRNRAGVYAQQMRLALLTGDTSRVLTKTGHSLLLPG